MRSSLRCLVLLALGLLLLLTYNERYGRRTHVTIITASASSGALEPGQIAPFAEVTLRPPPSPMALSSWDGGLNARYRALLRHASRRHDDDGRLDGRRRAVLVLGGNCSGNGRPMNVRNRSGSEWATRCLCAPGWSGAACETREASACNTPQGGRVLTRCAGTCDEDVNRCLCGPGSRFPHRPMVHCRYEGVEKDMPWQTPNWANFAKGPRRAFWSAAEDQAQLRVRGATVAWCDADPALRQRPKVRCECYDGQDKERMCAPIAPRSTDATFCLGQCHGRGECRSGYCECREGYLGADCSLTSDGQRELPPAAEQATPSGRATASDSSGGGGGGGGGSGGGAALVPRPRVYVYELPGEFNTFLSARRQAAESCALREYVASNGGLGMRGGDDGIKIKWSGNLYGASAQIIVPATTPH